MSTQLDSIEHEHPSDAPKLRTRGPRRPADAGRQPSRVGACLFRNIAGVILSGAVLGHISPAQAQVTPFGIPCNSVGVAGIPYVPGVNCRLMAVDGYTRRYVVWVPLGGVAASSPAVFMLHGASGTGEQFLAIVWLATKGDAGRLRRHFSNRGRTFRAGDPAILHTLEQLRPSGRDRPQSATGRLPCDGSLASR